MTRRLILALVFLCLTEAVLIGALVRVGTRRSFDRFVREEAIAGFREDLTRHFEARGSWDGLADRFGAGQSAGGRATGGRGRPGPARPRFGFADESGRVVVSDGSLAVDDQVDARALAHGVLFDAGGTPRGTILMPADPTPAGSPERRFLADADRALLVGVAAAIVVALVLGTWLASATTRPIRDLTAAAGSLARGELGAQVRVRAEDETATLTRAFNAMSAQLARASEQRRQMTADVAHELRTPLTVLTGCLEAMRDGTLAPNEERIGAMYAEAQRLSRLVEDLRTLSLAEAGELPLQSRAVVVRDLLEGVRIAYEPFARAKNVTLAVEPAGETPALAADPDRIAQVLSNLVTNALRFTPEGGRVLLSSRREADRVRIDVADTGPGISAESLPRVFDRFYRADPSRHRSRDESGLGLAIARALVEAHAGTIAVESTPDRGATFVVRLPAYASPENR